MVSFIYSVYDVFGSGVTIPGCGFLLHNRGALFSLDPKPVNVVISNVPGPSQQMYYGGARLDGSYPLSNIPDGQALNITLTNNAGNLDFGLVGCRRSVPHLQRLLNHLDSSLKDLEQAVGV